MEVAAVIAATLGKREGGAAGEGGEAGAASSPAGEVDLTRFLKLVQLGQPLEHIRMRMQAEGVDPDLLPDMK